jgi:predicted KAP-like P-loop ATPase
VLIPDHETAVDFLNYEAVAHTVVRLLKDNRQHALTLGIHGDWGAGKSSVLKMVDAAMAKDDSVACLWFNGWAFQGFDDAKTVLIEIIITELLRKRKAIAKAREIGGRLVKRIDGWKLARRAGGLAFNVMTGLPSPDQITTAFESIQALAGSVKSMSPDDIQGKLTELGGFLKPAEERSIPEQIYHFREEFKELLEVSKIDQLVVLIDDLDRCLPATAIDTLEAIRLFLFVDKTAFIIGADEGMIEYAVREHFPNLPLATGPVPYARNYLEKLIQVPFRIPALGVQESRAYVTLLLVQSLVGEDHVGFKTLLAKARESLNRPWLGASISQADVRAVDTGRRDDLDAAFVVAQQIGPILAEGTKGNPRQIKRFLNALYIRLTIAGERGFGDDVNPAVLGKLMLAERFQPDFYEYLATEAMRGDGTVTALRDMEAAEKTDGKAAKEKKLAKTEKPAAPEDEAAKWSGREWVAGWLKIEPALTGVDLRPYVFVAREKRIVGPAEAGGALDVLIEALAGTSEMAARGVEPQLKALTPTDADQLAAALRDRVLRHGNFTAMPPGFFGLMLAAKYHPRYQSEVLGLLRSAEPRALGVWVVTGWTEILTDAPAQEQLRTLLNHWATQNDNAMLKRAAGQALAKAPPRGAR